MQLNIFESSIMERYKIENHVRLIELFAGIGAQHKALEILSRNGYIPFGYEAYKICEFDKYAVNSYNAVHGTNFETSDITKIHAKDLEIVDRDKHTYIMCYSFPCTDLSNAGKMAGMRKGTGTRSGLLWEVERLLNECGNELPQVLVMENVPAVESEKNINDFRDWLHYLSSKGYHNFEQICNATEIGYPEPIPQNRKRCFMVSILDDKVYSFPEKRKLRKKLKDLLEEEVDDKYYLSQKLIDCFMADGSEKYCRRDKFLGNIHRKNQQIANTITTNAGSRPTDNYIFGNKRLNETLQANNVKDKDFIDAYNRTITTDVSGTITTRVDASNNVFVADFKNECGPEPYYQTNSLSIRKLTPKECWRLMGFEDEDYERASKVNSNAQLYKQAGNSIVVNCLAAIFKEMF